MARKIVTANKISRPGGKQQASVAVHRNGHAVDWESLLAGIPGGKSVVEYGALRNIFMQGQPADSVFYLRRGKAVCSRAVVA